MSFNLGRPRFSKFKNMIGAVQDGDFSKAADEILDSKAARDPLTKSRYEKLADEMRGLVVNPAEMVNISSTDPREIAKQLPTEVILEELKKRTGI